MRYVKRLLFPPLLCAAIAGFQGVAVAQDVISRTKTGEEATWTDLVRRARRARAAGRWVEAAAGFTAALAAANAAKATDARRAELAGELGLCELEAKQYRDAAEHLAMSLSHRMALSPALRGRVQAGQRKTEARVARLYLAVNPPDAEVLVDGRALGTPVPTYEVFLEPGHHTVRARLPAHVDGVQSFDVGAGAVHSVAMQLPRAEEPPTPAETVPRPPRAVASPASRRSPSRAPSWVATLRIVGVGVTTATAAAGALFFVRAAALDGDLEERGRGLRAQGWPRDRCQGPATPPACTEVHDLGTERDLLARVGVATLSASGLFAAVTAASFFTDFSFLGAGPAREKVRVVPVATGHEAGLSFQGAW